ncbi:TPA: conjugal transfer protein TrbE [Klebsiella michiganensis]|nr:conjugal transfer protein TrbE [Klebsiella michiganensis]
MKVNFHKKPVVDFVVRLLLTIIIISPVLYFSWDTVKGTSGGDYIESVVFILVVGFFWCINYLFFTAFGEVIQKMKVDK